MEEPAYTVATIEQDYQDPGKFQVQFYDDAIERNFDMDQFIERVAVALDQEVQAANRRHWTEGDDS